MKEMILKLAEDLTEIFPDIDTITITPETMLEEIPDWDSMAAINLQLFLNEEFGIHIEQDFFNDDTSFREVSERIEVMIS